MVDLTPLEKKLGVSFKDKHLLTQALTHRSYLNENPVVKQSNERLEFLGDSVLSLLTSTRLFEQFPKFPEGQLTNLRSNLVRAKTLAAVAKSLDLGSYLLVSHGEEKGGGRENDSLLADLFEAVLGAIYLDQGLGEAGAFLKAQLFPLIPTTTEDATIFDFKSRLQEKTQSQTQHSPQYRVISETGPDHNKTFVVGVYLKGKQLATGSGKSKQEAEQDAARIALDAMK